MSNQHKFFEYEPLPTRTSIRVLKINGRNNEGLIDCTIKAVDLADDPWYHALSYTWGDPHPDNDYFEADHERYDIEKREEIRCNGKQFFVSRNLYDALLDVPRNAWAKRCNRGFPGKKGRRELHWAAMVRSQDLVTPQICDRVDLDVLDDFGRTPLSYAAEFGHVKAVESLVSAGADIRFVDKGQKTALDYAREKGYTDIIDRLEQVERQGGKLEPSLENLPDGPQAWIWIDQICINQNDLEERSTQVLIMDQIYQKAYYTLQWLGAETRYTQTAIEVVKKLDSAPGNFQTSDIEPYTSQDEEVYRRANIPFVSMEEWTALASLFLRRYFRRLWVVQENILARTQMGYWGPYEVPWEAFCRVAQYVCFRQMLLGHVTSTKFINITDAVNEIETEAVYLVQWRGRFIDGEKAAVPKQFSLENMIFDTWTFHTTDPRDQVFGLYGLLNTTGQATWQPDYTKSVEQVYAEATKKIIEESGDLHMLSATVDRSLKNIPTLPCWVPDYSMPYTRMMCATYKAAGNLPKLPIRPTSWATLGVSGVKIDDVLQIGNMTRGPKDPIMFFDQRWLELTLLLPSVYHNGESRTEVLWRTLCANRTRKMLPAPESFGTAFHEMICKLTCIKAKDAAREALADPRCAPTLEAAVARAKEIMSTPPLSTLTPDEIEQEFFWPDSNLSGPNQQTTSHLLFKLLCLSTTESSPYTPTIDEVEIYNRGINWEEEGNAICLPSEGAEFYYSLTSKYGKRRLFVTGKRYLGLGPASMMEGDEVWVLAGAGAAFVLRREGDGNRETYQFVGEAYVHGIMDGEAVEEPSTDIREIELV